MVAVDDLGAGVGRPITLTLQALVEDASGVPRATNAVVIDVR